MPAAPVEIVDDTVEDEPGATGPTALTGPTGVTGITSVTGASGPMEVLEITAVSVTGSVARHMRQGGSGTVTLTGTGFVGASAVSLKNGGTAYAGTIGSVTATSLSFTVAIPHGAPLGSFAVELTATLGTTTFTGAVVVTAITVAASGNDTNAGTGEQPLRTITQALSLASSGDTVTVGAGTFSAASGETFFSTLSDTSEATPTAPVNIPAGIVLAGAAAATTIIDGAGTTSKAGIVTSAALTLQKLTVRNFRANVIVTGGTLTLDTVGSSGSGVAGVHVKGSGVLVAPVGSGCTLTGNAHGLWLADNGSATLSYPVISSNTGVAPGGASDGSAGVKLTDAASITMTGGFIEDNLNFGLISRSTGTVTLTDVQVGNNADFGNPGNAQIAIAGGSAVLTNVDVHPAFSPADDRAGQFGVDCASLTGAPVNLVLTNSQVHFPRAVGLIIGPLCSVTMRGSKIEMGHTGGNDAIALYEDGRGRPGAVDFGTALSLGGNTVTFDTTGHVAPTTRNLVNDLRAATGVTGQVVTYSGNDIRFVGQSNTFTSGCHQADIGTGPFTLKLVNPGSCAGGTGNLHQGF